MAISFKNVITKLYSGRVGDIVLRNYGGKSVMAKRPDCSKVVKSPAQLENQKRFAKAVKISKAVKNDPERAKFYIEKKRKTKYKDVYHAVMSDCMTKPKMQKVDLTTYRGQQGIGLTSQNNGFLLRKIPARNKNLTVINKMGDCMDRH